MVDDIIVTGVKAGGFRFYTAGWGAGDLVHKDIEISNVDIYYNETGNPTSTCALVTAYDDITNATFTNIITYNASCRLVLATSGKDIDNFTFTGITIDTAAAPIDHIAYLNSGTDFEVYDSFFPEGSYVHPAFRPSKIKFFNTYVGEDYWND